MWSQKFEKCIKCGTTEQKHSGRGLCVNCYRIDIEKRHRVKKRKQLGRISHYILTKEYLVREYIDNNKSLAEIAKACNCQRSYVFKRMREFNIPLRSKSEARELAYDQKKIVVKKVDENGTERNVVYKKININESFFSSWSKEMAYVLGVIYTDGNLFHDRKKKTFRVKVSQNKPELLNKILKLMNCDASLYHREKREYESGTSGELYIFDVNNKKIYKDLKRLGLNPNKSLLMGFPDIPSEHIRHFIRGCWDGDGSIYVENHTNTKGASYVSGSKKFIEGMLAELEKLGMPKRTIHEIKRKNISYYLRFTGDQCDKLFHILYDDVPSSQYLERKYNIFKANESDEGADAIPKAPDFSLS